MQRKWIRITIVAVLLSLPFFVNWLYHAKIDPPKTIRIATGPDGGRYREIGKGLQAALHHELNDVRGLDIDIQLVHTEGSLANLEELESGAVDFALYEPGTRERLGQAAVDGGFPPAFVANVYSAVSCLIVHRDSGIKTAHDLHPKPGDPNKKRVALGKKSTANYAMSLNLLDHLGLDENKSIDAKHIDYREIERRFAAGTIDAAFITTGTEAPILRDLLTSLHCRLIEIPNTRALSLHNISLTPTVIPIGLFRSGTIARPESEIETVAVRVQLLTRKNQKTGLVTDVTNILLDGAFQRKNRLLELFRDGKKFAGHKPEFTIHPGASHAYDPKLRPVLNSDFVEAMEGMRSFLVSILIAGYLFFRWNKDRRIKKQEHRLDRYIHALLDIEKRQLKLDEVQDKDDQKEKLAKDIEQLQKLLDEVTQLRQNAFAEFTAHQLSEDRATDCFLELCHSLSNKINAKLTRQRFDSRMLEMIEAVNAMAVTESDVADE